MSEFLIKLVLSVVMTIVVKGVVALFGASIAWWLAAIIALVLVFGGWFILVDSDDLGWD